MGIKPQVYGTRDDEWYIVSFHIRLMVGHKDVMVHLCTEDSRLELSLEHKWKYK